MKLFCESVSQGMKIFVEVKTSYQNKQKKLNVKEETYLLN